MDARATVDQLAEMKVWVPCLAPGGVDLISAAVKMTMAVIAAVAEFERDLLVERIQAGLTRANAEGKVLGRPSVLTTEQQADIQPQRTKGVSPGALAQQHGVSRSHTASGKTGARGCLTGKHWRRIATRILIAKSNSHPRLQDCRVNAVYELRPKLGRSCRSRT